MQWIAYFVLIPMVYVALASFALGTGLQGTRILLGLRFSLKHAVGPEKRPKVLGALFDTFLLPAVLKNYPFQWAFLMIFHGALFLLILGHLELIGEIAPLQIIRHEVFLGGGVIGILLSVALLIFLFRRFHSPLRELSDPGNYYILILLLLAVLFGSQLHLARRLYSYSAIGVEEYREYLSGIFALRPALPVVFQEEDVGHTFLLVLHVFFANLFLMVFPFSKIMHSIVALPLNRLRRR